MNTSDAAVESSAAPNGSCLIVEDELLIGMDLEDAVSRAGYEPRWFASERSALLEIDRYMPNVAVIDVHLQDGYCAELIRELLRRNIPFVVHSASSADEAAPQLRGVTWMPKPTEPAAILKALMLALQSARRNEPD